MIISPGSDLHACAALVERADPQRFASVMAAPLAARSVLFPIYAFNVEVARAPWVSAEPMIAEMRLQWWRDALDEIAKGGFVRRHEVVTPLALVLDAEGAQLLDGVIEARRLDLDKAPFADADALWRYLEATSGALMQVAARALGDTSDGSTARDLGSAMGLVSYLQAVPALEARAKLPLPDGRPEAIQALARDGQARLAKARKSRSKVVPKARPALQAGALAGPLLARIARAPAHVADDTIAPAEAYLRVMRMWVALTGRW